MRLSWPCAWQAHQCGIQQIQLFVNHGPNDRQMVTHPTLERVHTHALIIAVKPRPFPFVHDDRVEAITDDTQIPREMAVSKTALDIGHNP